MYFSAADVWASSRVGLAKSLRLQSEASPSECIPSQQVGHGAIHSLLAAHKVCEVYLSGRSVVVDEKEQGSRSEEHAGIPRTTKAAILMRGRFRGRPRRNRSETCKTSSILVWLLVRTSNSNIVDVLWDKRLARLRYGLTEGAR